MSRFSQLRTRYLTSSDSTSSARSPASLSEKASRPPERLHRTAGGADDPAVLYIFRIPGRRELCLSNLRPGGDVVTDIDVSAALYILRFDAAHTPASITLLRSIEGQMEEVAYIEDPPGHIDVFEEEYSHIEPRYWDVHSLEPKAVKASFSCQVTATDGGLSFQTPWVGTANIAPVKLGNALRCYHTIRHAEGDEAQERMQVSELRFNFQMPKGVAPASATASKRASIANFLRDTPASGRVLTRGTAQTSSFDASDMTSTADEPMRMSNSHGTTQPSWKRRSRLDPTSFFASPPIQGLPAGSPASSPNSSKRPDMTGSDAIGALKSVPSGVMYPRPSKTNLAAASSNAEATGRVVKGPRPMRATTTGNLSLEQGATQGHVHSGKPIEMSSTVSTRPQVAENNQSVKGLSPFDGSQPSPSSVHRATLNAANTLSQDAELASRTPSIRRKPVGTATSQDRSSSTHPRAQVPVSRTSQDENEPPATISNRPTDPISPVSNSPIRRLPVSMFDTFDAIEAKEAAYSRPGSIKEPPPLPERPDGSDGVKPALPPRRSTTDALDDPHPRKTSLLDLSLGQEKLGGGFDGEQAKLGKLIVQSEGQKMLDLIVAANMLAFHRAFVAADVMGR